MVLFWDREYAVIARERADVLFIFRKLQKMIHFRTLQSAVLVRERADLLFIFGDLRFLVQNTKGPQRVPPSITKAKTLLLSVTDRTDGQTDGRTKIFEALYKSPFGAIIGGCQGCLNHSNYPQTMYLECTTIMCWSTI